MRRTDLVFLVKVEQQVLVESATQERAKQSSTVDTTICNSGALYIRFHSKPLKKKINGSMVDNEICNSEHFFILTLFDLESICQYTSRYLAAISEDSLAVRFLGKGLRMV